MQKSWLHRSKKLVKGNQVHYLRVSGRWLHSTRSALEEGDRDLFAMKPRSSLLLPYLPAAAEPSSPGCQEKWPRQLCESFPNTFIKKYHFVSALYITAYTSLGLISKSKLGDSDQKKTSAVLSSLSILTVLGDYLDFQTCFWATEKLANLGK